MNAVSKGTQLSRLSSYGGGRGFIFGKTIDASRMTRVLSNFCLAESAELDVSSREGRGHVFKCLSSCYTFVDCLPWVASIKGDMCVFIFRFTLLF